MHKTNSPYSNEPLIKTHNAINSADPPSSLTSDPLVHCTSDSLPPDPLPHSDSTDPLPHSDSTDLLPPSPSLWNATKLYFISTFGLLKNSGYTFLLLATLFYVGAEIVVGGWVSSVVIEYLKNKNNKQTTNATNKTKQNKTKQNKTKQNKTKQNKTKQNKTKTKQTRRKTERKLISQSDGHPNDSALATTLFWSGMAVAR
jgi:hypothetical protein